MGLRPRLAVLFAIALTLPITLAPRTTAAQSPSGSQYYVSPAGTSSNSGAIGSPWSLAYALSQPAAVRPGDTIWLRGGTYSGSFTSSLTGVTVRGYPGEAARLANNALSAPTLTVYGSGSTYRDFEVTNAVAGRPAGAQGTAHGVVVWAPDTHLVDLVVHDNWGQGVAWWIEGAGGELYGSLLYANGGTSNYDHNLYMENKAGAPARAVADNVLLNPANYNVHAYSSFADFERLYNLSVTGNVLAGAGALRGTSRAEVLVGGDGATQAADLITVTGNYLLHDGDFPAAQLGLDTAPANGTGRFTGNAMGGANTQVATTPNWASLTVSGNAPPAGPQVSLRPDRYQPGRGVVIVYNAPASLAVDLSALGLAPGQPYEARDAEDFYGAPVLSGTYPGGAVNLPLTRRSVARPTDPALAAPPHTAPRLAVFLVIPTNPGTGSGNASAAPTPVSPGSLRYHFYFPKWRRDS